LPFIGRIGCLTALVPVAAGAEAQAQGVQLDEALGVALVVDRVFLKGDVGEAVEAVRRLSADDAC
jgi:hypothetical protein